MGLQSLLSMKRTSLRKASAVRVRFSKSLASLRQRLSQARVRSTTHRFGNTAKRRYQKDAAIAILGIGGMNNSLEQEPEGIYKNMPLLTLDLFSCIVSSRIDRGPPFSALLIRGLKCSEGAYRTSDPADDGDPFGFGVQAEQEKDEMGDGTRAADLWREDEIPARERH